MSTVRPIRYSSISRAALPLGVALSLCLFSGTVMAQGSSLFGGGGSTGGSGSTRSTGSTTAAATSTARTATGGAGGAASGTGQLQAPAFSQFGTSTQTPTGFIGRGNATQFVGNTTAGQQTINAGGTTRFSGGGNGSTQSGEVESRAKLIRVQQRLAFPQLPVNGVRVQLNLETQFDTLVSRFPEIGIEVDAEGQTILTGMVDSDDDRKLAEVIARLEPGVRSVVNQLETPSSNTSPSATR